MEIGQEVSDFVKAVNEMKSVGEPLKQRYLDYIKDSSIPLDERWALFVDAPDFWKIHEKYKSSFKVESKIEMEWIDCFYYEKYETVNMVDVIDQVQEIIEDGPWDWTSELKYELMENILEQNLGSFKNGY